MRSRTALSVLAALVAARTAVAAEAPSAGAGTSSPVVAPAAALGDPSLAPSRVLNGHVFMPSATVPGALTTTSFGTFLILAYGNTTGSFQVADRAYSGSFDYAGAGAALVYEHAFYRYFSARLAVDEVIFSGIDGPSIIVVGTALQVAFSLGATASLPIGDSLRVGVLLDVESSPGLALTIGNGLQTIVENCRVDPNNCRANEGSVFGTNRALTLKPALAANWAPWRPLGLTANAAYINVSQDQGDDTFKANAVRLAGAADFDFLAVSGVPVGLQLAFAWTAPIDGTVLQHITDLGGGIFYTGSQHLALGLQLISRRFAVQPTVDVSWSTLVSTIGLRYYW
jgi:hypothetical protein